MGKRLEGNDFSSKSHLEPPHTSVKVHWGGGGETPNTHKKIFSVFQHKLVENAIRFALSVLPSVHKYGERGRRISVAYETPSNVFSLGTCSTFLDIYKAEEAKCFIQDEA